MDSSATIETAAPSPGSGDPQAAPTAAHPLAGTPPLARLAALGAIVGAALHRLLIPAFGPKGDQALWLEVERWGEFGANLAAVSGIVALSTGVLGFVRHNHHLRTDRRLLLLFFNVVFVSTVGASTLFDRSWTSADVVWLTLGMANILCVVLAVSALSLSPGRETRAVALAMACMSLFGLTARVLERLTVSVGGWLVQARDILEATGEIGYLAVLLVGSYWLVPRGERLRDNVARLVGLSVVGMVAGAFILAIVKAPNDYKLLLYHAQRVRLFIDSAPVLYAPIICIALGAATSASAGEDRVRRQGGTGLLLLLAAGYAPRAPGGLLALTLATCLLARAALAASWQVDRAKSVPTTS